MGSAIQVGLVMCVASVACADALDDVLTLVPKDSASMIAIPSLAKLSRDVDACIAGMDRKETAIAGRPVDQLRGMLGIKEGFDERGSMAAWTVGGVSVVGSDGQPVARAWVLLVPSEDPAAFVTANIAPNSEGIGEFRGEKVHARALAKHVLVSISKSAIDEYDPSGGIGADFAKRVGDRGMTLARGGDLIAWAGADALKESQSATPGRPNAEGEALGGILAGVAGSTDRFRELFAGMADGLLVVDADALGLSLRAYGTYSSGSQLGQLALDAKPVAGEGAMTLAGLPKAPFYCAVALDAQALGGASKLDALTSALGVSDLVPAWLSQAKEGVRSIRFACYPSKLGLIAGGFLNDCACLIETSQPQAIRDLFKSSLMAQTGNAEGVRREPAWEDGRVLKNGTVVDAFELKEFPLGPSEAQGVDLSGVTMRQMMRQAIFGSRGMHGFVQVLPSAVVITFSQRPDVLDRALTAAAGGESLKDDSVIVAMRPWLVPGAQCEAFISVGQILKVVRQLASTFGGGQMQLPTIPTRSPPVAFAFRVNPTATEASAMIPTATLAAVYDQVMSGAMGGRRGGERPPSEPPPESMKDTPMEAPNE